MIYRLRDAGMYRWIRAHQFAHFCCVICWSALFPTQSNTLDRHCCWLRSASARMFWILRISAWMWGSTKCCLIALFKQLWACSTGLKNGQYFRVELRRDGLRSPNGARPLLLRVKMLNPDSSMYTWRWWTPVKEKNWRCGNKQVNVNTDLDWPIMWRIENVARLCWDDFFHTVHRCPFQQSWWWWAGFEGAGLWLSLKLSLKLPCLGSEPPVPDQPRRWWWKGWL